MFKITLKNIVSNYYDDLDIVISILQAARKSTNKIVKEPRKGHLIDSYLICEEQHLTDALKNTIPFLKQVHRISHHSTKASNGNDSSERFARSGASYRFVRAINNTAYKKSGKIYTIVNSLYNKFKDKMFTYEDVSIECDVANRHHGGKYTASKVLSALGTHTAGSFITKVDASKVHR